MFKLKLINKPKMMKLKCNFTFPNMALANLQEKKATPSKQMQEIVADVPYDGLSKVIVDPIPDEYIIPIGDLEIIENGTYDVTEKVGAIVNVPRPFLINKTINENGTYKAKDDNVDGYSEVVVATSGVDINDYFFETLPDIAINNMPKIAQYLIKKVPAFNFVGRKFDQVFYRMDNLEEVDLSSCDFSNTEIFSECFSFCISLKKIIFPNIITNKITNISSFVRGCDNLETIDLSSCSFANVINCSYAFLWCPKLIDLKLNENHNLGQAFSTSQSENYVDYSLQFYKTLNLSRESLLGIINGLYDIATAGVKPQQLTLTATNLAKLTADEIAIATSRGWTVS